MQGANEWFPHPVEAIPALLIEKIIKKKERLLICGLPVEYVTGKQVRNLPSTKSICLHEVLEVRMRNAVEKGRAQLRGHITRHCTYVIIEQQHF